MLSKIPKGSSPDEYQKLKRLVKELDKFSWITYAWIVISAIHGYTTYRKYIFGESGFAWFFGSIITITTVVFIDISMFSLAGHIRTMREFKEKTHPFIWVSFIVALLLTFSMNINAHLENRPLYQDDPFADFNSIFFACVFGGFVPLIILTATFAGTSISKVFDTILGNVQKRNENRERKKELQEMLIPKEGKEQQNLPLESHKGVVQRNGNGKSKISTGDVESIVSILKQMEVKHFKSASELGRLLGWSSPTSATTGVSNLINAGVLVKSPNGGYDVTNL